MSYLDEAIQTGMGSGTFSGFLSHGIMISEAQDMLNDGSFKSPKSAYERGIVNGLEKHGFIKRKWGLFGYVRTGKPIPTGRGSLFEKMVIDAIRESDDDKIGQTGFHLKFAVALYDASKDMPWQEAKERASFALRDFCKSEKISFGHPDYDWSGRAARELAFDLEISYWD